MLGGAVDEKEAQNKKIPFGGAFGCSGGDFFCCGQAVEKALFFLPSGGYFFECAPRHWEQEIPVAALKARLKER